MTATLRLLPTLLLLAVPYAPPLQAQVARGRVIDATTRAPLAQAAVRLLDGRGAVIVRVVADDSGRFVLAAPAPGEYRFAAERIGYRTATVGPVRLAAGPPTDLQLRLAPEAIVLDALVVATEAQIRALEQVGFYDRKCVGLGRFLERRDIEERRPSRTTDLLRGMPGVRLVANAWGNEAPVLRAGVHSSLQVGLCHPRIFLDGIQVQEQGSAAGFDLERELSPWDLEAVEVYNSAALIPPQYGGAQASCGVILLWTRRGG